MRHICVVLLAISACKSPMSRSSTAGITSDSEPSINDPEFCTAEGNTQIAETDMLVFDTPTAATGTFALTPILATKPHQAVGNVIIGRDVLDEVANVLMQEIVQQVRMTGDLTRVNLNNLIPSRNDLKLRGDLKEIVSAVHETIDLSKVNITLTVQYHYGQLYNKAVAMIGTLVANYPINGRPHRCIGRRIGNHKGIVYRRFVAPMVSGAIAEIQRTADTVIRQELGKNHLNQQITVNIGRAAQQVGQTTLFLSSPTADFKPQKVTYREAKDLLRRLSEQFKRFE